MRLEDFQVNDNESIDSSIIKRCFTKNCHQQGANFKNSDQNIKFNFVENNNYHQNDNFYFQYDITVRNHDDAQFVGNSVIRLIKSAFACCSNADGLATTGDSVLEHNKNLLRISTVLRMITNEDDELLSYFDKVNWIMITP